MNENKIIYAFPARERTEPFMSLTAGMTLRDYFAAHAPVEPTWTFDIKIDDLGEAPTKQIKEGWRLKQNAYEAEIKKRRYAQWPYIYADVMLAERLR